MLSPAECLTAWTKGRVTLPTTGLGHLEQTLPFTKGMIKNFALFAVGRVYANGACDVGTYMLNGQAHTAVVAIH